MPPLWPASFGGFLFHIEKTKDKFGKKVVVHEFPNRDDPFVEELGQKANDFDFVAYLASPTAYGDADALKAALLAYGPQMLVLPDEGPVLAMFRDGTRDHERDKQGYVAFELRFVAMGAATAMASSDMFAQLGMDQVAAMPAFAASLTAQLAL
jgi:prophage DNA circulation protein